MKTSLKTFLTSITILTLVGAGCGSSQAPSPSAELPPQAAAPARIATGCSHEYHPLTPGHAISYSSKMGARNFEFTYRVKDVSGNRATIEYDFLGATSSVIEIEMECTPDGIKALSQVDFSKAFGGPMASATSKTKSATGELIPKDFHVGSEWSQRFESEAEIDNAMMKQAGMSNIATTLEMHHKAIGEESVTVPAGTYTAIKVETDMVVTTSLTPKSAPTKTHVKTTAYWVRGIGMVKSVSGEGSTATVMEATAITP